MLVLSALLAACGDGSDADYIAEVLHRASIEYACAPADISVIEIDHQTYLATGCGYRETYECGNPNGHSGVNPCNRAPTLLPEDAGSSCE
jgi:hypothetical protein